MARTGRSRPAEAQYEITEIGGRSRPAEAQYEITEIGGRGITAIGDRRRDRILVDVSWDRRLGVVSLLVGVGLAVLLVAGPALHIALPDWAVWVAFGGSILLLLIGGGLLLHPFVAPWLPTLTIKYQPPPARGKRKVRQVATSLVAEIRAYVRERPPPLVERMTEHEKVMDAMEHASDEAERNAIWREYGDRLALDTERDQQYLAERFGGRIAYLLGEYQRRGLIRPGEAGHLHWQAGSSHWIVQLASTLEGLAQGL